MRPMYLQMAGLQSYRELQEVDFTALCDAGVFGIFGPTGSGKSTILDAMTLALFGKVERAANGTQGIMNHAEQTLSVSFTFELGHTLGATRYRVDRQFKRGGDVSVNNTVSRLIRYQDGETVVLADKAGDVNLQVQDILGLSMQDFTRAVVLPQGKFAEFLALKGSDRRQMLQRLFHLEPYGDQLSAKTSARYKETDVAIKELAAEQQGLGDASQQALDAAAAQLQAAAQAAQQLRAQLTACEARAAEQRRVRELQQALAQAQRQLALHADRAPQVHALQARLARAAQAERAHPYARRLALAAARLTLERDAAAAAQAAQQLAQAALERASAAHAAAREALAAQETPLLLRLDKLQQALTLAAELERQQAELGLLAAQEAQAAGALQASREQLQRERELRDKALKLQVELKEEQKRTEVRSEDRERLQDALQEKRAIEQSRRQLEEQQAELKRHQQELDGLRHQVEAAQQQERQWGRQLGSWLQEVAEVHAAVTEQESNLHFIVEAVPLLLAERKQQDRQTVLHTMAAELASQLVSGDPCLVCGAVHHPQPFALQELSAAAEAEADKAVARLGQLQMQAGQQLLAGSQLLVKLNGAVQQWQPLQSQMQANEHLSEAAAALQAWGQQVETKPRRQQPVSEQELQAVFAEAEQALQQAQQRSQRLQQQLQQLLQSRGLIDRSSGEQQARQQSLTHLMEAAEQKITRFTQTAEQLTTAWNSRYTGLSYDSLESAAEQLRLQEQKAEELRQRLDKGAGIIEKNQHSITELQEQSNSLDRTCVQLQTEFKNMQQQVTEKTDRLREWAGEQPVDEQIAETSKQLEQLRNMAEQTKQAFESSQTGMQQTSHANAAAAKAAENAAEQTATAEAEWLEQAALCGFTKPEDVETVILNDEQKKAGLEEVEAYGKLEHQLQTEQKQLAEQLGGRSISEEVFLQLEEELAERKLQDEAAIQAAAKAEHDWESLQARHERWTDLETRRAARQSELELLGKLQTVLRGNAFVEFLAEEQLIQVSRAASERLGQLTRQKYAIEVDSTGGFVIRDDANGGVKRPVSSLSGGETFLTSLSLALALSAQIQLKGQHPLEFFFLDEGFGTLDQDLLETVIVALEKLHYDKLTVGVISHVPELRARLPRRLVVEPPEPRGRGSSLYLETL